jgi:uncharacterized membrane protein
MLDRLKAFGHFWYDFVLGDDWRVAVAVVLALTLTWVVSMSAVSAWWVTPVIFAVLLPLSLWRAVSNRL